MKINFNQPYIVGKELEYIKQAIDEYVQLSGDGEFTRKCHKWLETQFNIDKVLLTHSCTAALEMAAILCDIKPGDEIIMPSYTFVSTANAFVLRGAVPVFVDIRQDTLNIDETKIEPVITPRTKAIVPMHYAGVGCEMDEIMRIADKHNLLVVEDAAQGVNAFYKGRALGSIGHLGCFSFHETKNFISGEGGALAVNDERFARRAEIIREKGTNRAEFFRGETDKYTWCDVGSSYLPSELIAAFLYAQLENAEKITRKRSEIWKTYYDALKHLEGSNSFILPHIPDHCNHNGHMFYLLAKDADTRNALLSYLKDCGIQAIFHYIPLHKSPMAHCLGIDVSLPLTEQLAERIVRLPCYYELSETEQNYIIEKISVFFQ
jgi:dTDP-4-amino-4,6-dideoxygalactose transaminase